MGRIYIGSSSPIKWFLIILLIVFLSFYWLTSREPSLKLYITIQKYNNGLWCRVHPGNTGSNKYNEIEYTRLLGFYGKCPTANLLTMSSMKWYMQ